MKRGELWWASLREPTGSGPGYRRPVAIIQSDDFTASRIDTIVGATVTSTRGWHLPLAMLFFDATKLASHVILSSMSRNC